MFRRGSQRILVAVTTAGAAAHGGCTHRDISTATTTKATTTTASGAVAAASVVVVARRGFCAVTTPRLQQQQQPPTSSSSSSSASDAGPSAESAMDVAMRVNRMKKAHQTGTGGAAGRRQIEAEAWQALNSLDEGQVNAAEGKAVALLLNSWAYFAKFWEKGKDGPMDGPAGAKAGQE